MKRHHVQSSALESVGYDPAHKILEIGFRQGGVWQYLKLPVSVYREFIKAESLGNYFVTKIKGKYHEVKMG